jgi:hypothetical protein
MYAVMPLIEHHDSIKEVLYRIGGIRVKEMENGKPVVSIE